MAVDAALISAGAAVGGDILSSMGQQGTNDKTLQMNAENNRFSAEQADINRNFQASQSATAMQTRVADLKAAGLNPALAYQLGGAQAMSGNAPSSVGTPSLQNPNLGFGQLGNQVSSALQLNTQQAQVDLLKAQAAKAGAETASEIPAGVQNLQSQTALNDMRAQEAYKNVQMLSLALNPANTSDASMYTKGLQADLAVKAARAQIAQMDAQTQSDTMLSLIKARNDINFAESIGAENVYHASDGSFGRLMAYFTVLRPAATSAGQVAGAASDVAAMVP